MSCTKRQMPAKGPPLLVVLVHKGLRCLVADIRALRAMFVRCACID